MNRQQGREVPRPSSRPLVGGAVLLGFLLTGCGGSSSPSEPQNPAPLPERCPVVRVVDGDTVECDSGERIRLIGIDAPELDQTPFGDRSTGQLAGLVDAATVRLEYDIETRDRFGRLLAYLWLDLTLVNEQLVRDGWAVAFIVPPNTRYEARLRAAESAAQQAGAGHWGTGGFDCLPADHRAGLC